MAHMLFLFIMQAFTKILEKEWVKNGESTHWNITSC